jgi:poly-gamma-glutamate synthesis protein (capsule biosynthesis protein)
MDWGYAGLAETLVTLRSAGLPTVGAGKNIDEAISPARIPIEGKGNVLVFGFADGSCGVPDSWRAGENRAGVNLLSDLSARTTRPVAKRIRALKKTDDTIVA